MGEYSVVKVHYRLVSSNS